MKTSELIELKINEGKIILQDISRMRPSSGPAINVVYYISEDVEKCRKAIEKWQLTSKDVLIAAFGETHRYVTSFSDTVSRKNSGFNYQREFTFEVNKGLSVLEGVHESMQLGVGIENKEEMEAASKSPMVFISHSSKDKGFANALVELLENIGLDSSNLFCSSVEGYGIALSQDIFETLRYLFNEHNLFVIFIHSPRYYMSAVSLNEMGAAWVLKTDFCSFLTTDMEFSKMTGVVNGSTISIKVDASDTASRLTELKDKLTQLFGLPSIDQTKWERKRKAFLTQVLSMEYEEDIKETNSSVSFSDEELGIFNKWANNDTDSTFMAAWTQTGLNVHFGYHNGFVFPHGEALAEYEDFMNRLQQAGYIVVSGSRDSITYYSITKRGYDFAKTL